MKTMLERNLSDLEDMHSELNLRAQGDHSLQNEVIEVQTAVDGLLAFVKSMRSIISKVTICKPDQGAQELFQHTITVEEQAQLHIDSGKIFMKNIKAVLS